ncbi:MAG: ABC transporter substrate-binding protein [Alphaproteobacteria bacterium]|jgi:phospholipid transport system substrate-binding protein|nr:ABC transporter substrate-binding protein [Alphaproteobacteria bacterium]
MVSRRRFCLTLLAGAAVPWQSVAAAVSAAEVEAASRFMDDLAKQAIELLRRTRDDADSRQAAFRQLLSTGFDVPFIGRFALGRHWRGATTAQRQRYLALFTEFLIQTYTRRLSDYSSERFQITGARAAGKRDVIVQTRIERPDSASIRADWRVRGGAGGHRVIDVSVEGISMAVTQRTEFASVVRSHGMDGLLQALESRARIHLANAS